MARDNKTESEDFSESEEKIKSKKTQTGGKKKASNKSAAGSKTSKKTSSGSKKAVKKTKGDRYFKLVDKNGNSHGRYTGGTPKQAASKGFTKMLQKIKANGKNQILGINN